MQYKKLFSSKPQKRYNKIVMHTVITLALMMCLPVMGFAQIPNVNNSYGGQQNTQTYGNPYGNTGYGNPYGNAGYNSPYGNTGYGNPYNTNDPYLAQSRMNASNTANMQTGYSRMGKFIGLGASLLQIFTGKGSFGDKVQFLVLDQLNRKVAQPFTQQAQQAMSLENLYNLANRGMAGPQGYTQGQAQCLGCITPHPNGWQPGGGTNGQSMSNAFTSFSAVGGEAPSAPSGGGSAGVVSAIK